jgi:hypothetical protein
LGGGIAPENEIIPHGRYLHPSFWARTMPTKYNSADETLGIHLVSSTPAPRPEECRLTLGRYTADIVVSKREENCCYYVLQRVGSAEIIDMQRFDSAENAEAAAYAALKRWNGQDLLRHLAS